MRCPCCCKISLKFENIAERSMPLEIKAGGRTGGACFKVGLLSCEFIHHCHALHLHGCRRCSDDPCMESMNKDFILECTGNCNRHLPTVVTWRKD